ncbi:MAG: hypothetical protein JJ855_18255 [Rhodospirillales bacterium]|nr:hypothetical protein [Rhodospirillales bacterium]
MSYNGRTDSALGSVAVTSVQVPLEDVMGSGCRGIYEHWNAVRGDRFAPNWNAFDLIRLPGDRIRYSHVVDITVDPFDVTFRFWGTGLTDVLYFDRTGQSLLTTDMGYLDEHRRQQVLADYQAVIETRTPMPFLWDASSTRELARRLIVPSIRLPLSKDGETVTNIVTHFDFASQQNAQWEALFDVRNRNAR